MTGQEMSDEELMPLFEAARWAPSSMNNQVWRFVYAKRDSEHWEMFFGWLGEFNQSWCVNASALVVTLSRKKSFYKDASQRTHSFEAGAAYENLALEGAARGLVVHGMAGFDYDKVHEDLGLNDDWQVEMMAAIGVLGKTEDLPEELQEREVPSEREPLHKIVWEGGLPEEEM